MNSNYTWKGFDPAYPNHIEELDNPRPEEDEHGVPLGAPYEDDPDYLYELERDNELSFEEGDEEKVIDDLQN